MKILVTGGAGFMGNNFVRHMLSSSHDIVNLDAMKKEANPKNISGIKAANYSFIKGDITNAADVAKASSGVDVIINYAAETHVDRSISNPRPFLESNVFGVLQLLEAVRRMDIKFIQIGTDEVYGTIDVGSFSEKTPINPRNPYSASKASADILIQSFIETYGIDAVMTRSCNNFGPRQNPEKFVPMMITNVLLGKKIPIYGSGKNVREWIFVEDHCSAIEFILKKGVSGELYNIGSGNEKTNIEVAKTVLSLMGKSERAIEFVKDRPGHDFRYSINFEKLRKLGWKPRFEFDEALKETIAWYKNNAPWWKSLT